MPNSTLRGRCAHSLNVVLVVGVILLGGTALAEDAPVTGTFDTHEVSFFSHGVMFSGTVIVPRSPVVAAAVFVQGAGSDLRTESQGEALARFGIAVLVYDKRGVDRSGWRRLRPAHVCLAMPPLSYSHLPDR